MTKVRDRSRSRERISNDKIIKTRERKDRNVKKLNEYEVEMEWRKIYGEPEIHNKAERVWICKTYEYDDEIITQKYTLGNNLRLRSVGGQCRALTKKGIQCKKLCRKGWSTCTNHKLTPPDNK